MDTVYYHDVLHTNCLDPLAYLVPPLFNHAVIPEMHRAH